MKKAFEAAGYKTQVKTLADFHDAYGLEGDDDDGAGGEDEEDDEDDGSGSDESMEEDEEL